MLPLHSRLKKETHRKIAYVQDLIVQEVYSVFEKAILHGGTGIWRCYQGKRFSEDLDFYLPKDQQKIERLFENLRSKGFQLKKKKVSENSIYSELELNRTSLRLEATFQKAQSIICDYEMYDGNTIAIYSLSAESFLKEKINTYLKRQKIRDLWDIFFLMKKIKDPTQIKELDALLKNFKKPIDEDDIKVIILEGIIPSVQEMRDYIQRKWENKYI